MRIRLLTVAGRDFLRSSPAAKSSITDSVIWSNRSRPIAGKIRLVNADHSRYATSGESGRRLSRLMGQFFRT